MGVSVGGRSSTRVPRAGPPQCQFDHGLAYLTQFKAHGATKYPQHGGTPESDQILEQWIAKGWVRDLPVAASDSLNRPAAQKHACRVFFLCKTCTERSTSVW